MKLFISALMFFIVATGIVILSQPEQKKPSSQTSQETQGEVVEETVGEREIGPLPSVIPNENLRIGLDVSLVSDAAKGDGELVIALVPKSGWFAISTFNLRFTLVEKAGIKLQAGNKVKVDNDFAQSGWAFPIAQIDRSGGKTTVELSAAQMAQTPFVLKDRQVIATVPLLSFSGNQVIEIELDERVTRIYSKEGEAIKLLYEPEVLVKEGL